MEEIRKSLDDMGLRVGRVTKRMETCRCRTCGKDFEGQVTTAIMRKEVPRENYPGMKFVDEPKEYWPEECPGCKAERKKKEREQREIERHERMFQIRLKHSNLPPETRDTLRLGKFHRLQGKGEAYTEAVAYVKADEPKHHFISFTGEAGRGKTHLAIAIGWYFLENTEKVVRYYQAQELLDELKLRMHSRDAGRYEDYDMFLAAAKNCGVLIIDDLGAENITEWAGVTFDSIIDHRYIRGLRTVITSNCPADELPDRIVSRMSEGIVCVVKGIDYRGIKGRRNQRE
jgi:DNA replication protein DnaC